MSGETRKTLGVRPEPAGLDVTRAGDLLTIAHATSPAAGCGLVMVTGVAFALTVVHGLTSRHWAPAETAGMVLVLVAIVGRIWAWRRTVYSITPRSVEVQIVGFLGRTVGEWEAGNVVQVFLRERVRSHTRTDTRTKRKRRETTTTWDVILRDGNDKEHRLAKDLWNRDWALFIEQEIEDRLGVVERREGKGPQR